jgi:head-tail adaptor
MVATPKRMMFPAAPVIPVKPLEPWQALDLIRARVGSRSLRAAGAEMGLSAAYLSDILSGRRDISAAVALKLNLRKDVETIVRYWPVDSTETAAK